jgi:hypothetical protein
MKRRVTLPDGRPPCRTAVAEARGLCAPSGGDAEGWVSLSGSYLDACCQLAHTSCSQLVGPSSCAVHTSHAGLMHTLRHTNSLLSPQISR